MRKFHLRWLGAAMVVPGIVVDPVWAQSAPGAERYGYGPHMMWWDGGWSMMFFGPLFMIITLVALVAAIVFFVRWFGVAVQGGTPAQLPRNAALDILKERFAKGEIDKAEFEERRRVLGE
jgi:putative membrane protein